MPKATVRSILWLLLIMVLFYWKILLTRQVSLLTGSEGVHQAYSRDHFWTGSLRQGALPLWDPYLFAGRMGWPHMLESSIWLPLIFLFLLRACKAGTMRQALLRACLSGLSLGMAILAGGLHIVMMQALVIVSAVAFYAFPSRSKPNG